MHCHITVQERPDKDTIHTLHQQAAANDTRRLPGLAHLPTAEVAVVLRTPGTRLAGGAVGIIGAGWLYVDLLWVHPDRRRGGLGARLLHALEQAARQHFGVDRAYLFTASFQAPRFYPARGYTPFGETPDRPAGHTCIYFKREYIPPAPVDPQIEVQIPPHPQDLRELDAGLRADSAPVAPISGASLAVIARQRPGGPLCAGVLGSMYWGACDLQLVWLDVDQWRTGCAAPLLAQLEAACRERGLPDILLDIMEPAHSEVLLTHWLAAGFERFAVLEGRPPGGCTHFLRRRIPPMRTP